MTPLHTYRLEKYHGTASRHRCPHCNRPRCFTLYVDAQGRPLHPTVGRCDHESSCAYHYTPRQFFADHPTLRPASPKASPSHRHSVATGRPASCPTPQRLCTIPSHYMWRSESLNSHLMAYLATIYGRDAVAQAASIYRIGATRSHDTIFWQIDINGLVRTGKIMAYDPTTGHRLRNAHGVDWVHARLLHNGNLQPGWTLTQCLFGEHRLALDPHCQRTVALVESEKTAFIGSLAFPSLIWLATGGKSQFSPQKMQVLAARRVMLFPDIDAHADWASRAACLNGICASVQMADALTAASDADRLAKIDIADWL